MPVRDVIIVGAGPSGLAAAITAKQNGLDYQVLEQGVLGIPGEDLPHVHHFYGESHPYYRQRVVVVGGGNSAAESSLEMFRAGAHVTVVHRHSELKNTIKYWVRPDIDNRIREGSIAARFSTNVTEIKPTAVVVRGPGGTEEIPADAV